MTEGEDKAREEKLAAAKKRYEQLKKQKGKKGSAAKNDEQSKAEKSPAATSGELRSAKEESPWPISEGSKLDDSQFIDVAAVAEELGHQTRDGNSFSPETSGTHGRQPSLSIQSKMRSESFRRSSLSQPPSSPPATTTKSPALPPLSPEGDTMTDIYRKQAARLEQLEKANRKLEKELKESEERRMKAMDEAEELREAKGELPILMERAKQADNKDEEIEKLRGDIASLQRQNAHLQSQTSRSSRRISSPGQAVSPSLDLDEALQSKSAIIESMEVEISNLRAQLSTESSSSTARDEQVAALEEKLQKSEKAAESALRELTDLKKNLERISERAVKEGSQRSSAETKVRSLEREVEDSKQVIAELQSKCEATDKKVSTLTTLHKETDARSQAKTKERDRFEEEAKELRKRLTAADNQVQSLRQERDRLKGEPSHDIDDEAIDELENDARRKLQSRVRELESEVFDLRRGIWREKRREMDTGPDASDGVSSPTARFDDVDLGAGPIPKRGGPGAGKGQTFSDVLSGGLAALTGGGIGGAAAGQGADEFEEDDMDFDEEAFRRAQEEEARLRVERVKEVKRGLKKWQGWRLDLVESRAAGGGHGEIFEV